MSNITAEMSSFTKVGGVDVHHLRVDMSDADRAAYVASMSTRACYRVIDCTLSYILDRLCGDERFARDADRLRAYVDLYGNCCSKNNVWSVSMLPLTRAAVNHIIACENAICARQQQLLLLQQQQLSDHGRCVMVVSKYLVSDIDDSYEIGAVLAECFAFMETGAPCRGTGECTRGGTLMTPEGFASVLSSVCAPGWRACEIPPGSHICALVLRAVDAGHAEAHVFRRSSGEEMSRPSGQSRPNQQGQHGVIFDRAEDAPPAVPGRVSLFECAYDPRTGVAALLDCAVCNGISVRALPLSKRIDAAAREITNWVSSVAATALELPTVAITVLPPLTLAGAGSARGVLFAKYADPYDLRCGGSAFLWRQPTLDPSAFQAVLTCRNGEAMAVETYKSCKLSPVGRCCCCSSHSCYSTCCSCDCKNKGIPKHMGCYVCTPDLEANAWIIVREAKRSERLYTVEEAAACIRGETVATQITRAGMMRLMRQITVAAADPASADISTKSPGAGATMSSRGGQRVSGDPEGGVDREKKASGVAGVACAVPPKKPMLTKRAGVLLPLPPQRPLPRPRKPVAATAVSNAFGALDVDEAATEKKLAPTQTKHR